ncbi:hypothetical protein BS614_04375 [Paenibacillus xylanexedens]|uniref:hypothetical protein n=1 Tax=Paenibacillus xylanexedens TaxID=528191 RepID=UPI0009382024|nr:hypothetical protein [Paenibacillus xylanexedens]APO43362.1 hypothetical protein BS614_04375 [Paenibacillus xylanexedens]
MNIDVVIKRYEKRVLFVKRYTRKNKLIALMNAKASLAVEGMHLTASEDNLIMERLNGNLKNSEFLAHAMELARNV